MLLLGNVKWRGVSQYMTCGKNHLPIIIFWKFISIDINLSWYIVGRIEIFPWQTKIKVGRSVEIYFTFCSHMCVCVWITSRKRKYQGIFCSWRFYICCMCFTLHMNCFGIIILYQYFLRKWFLLSIQNNERQCHSQNIPLRQVESTLTISMNIMLINNTHTH